MKFESLIICVLAGFVVVNGYTQEKAIDTTLVNELQEVVLTATRTERQLSSLPLPVTIVSQETIKQSGTIRLNEILNEQTGIITVADESGFEGIQIQGIASDYILILIDGVPLVGRKAGNFDVNRLTVGNIKQIEVVKGPSSSLYGSEALGGVINIITEKPKSDVLSGNASYRIASYTQQDINVDIKQRIKKLGYGVFANRFSSEGYDLTPDTAGQTVNPFENYTFNGRLYYDFSDRFSLFLSGRLYTQYQDAGFATNTTNFEGDSEEQEWNSHIRFDHKWSDRLTTQYEFYYTNYNAKEQLADSSSGDIVSNSDFDQRLLRPEIRTTYEFKDRNKLTLGVGFQYDQLDRTFFDKQVDFNSQYVYAQYDTHLIERLNVITGVRFDNHSEYSNQFSPKLALRYKITETLAAKVSIGYGFKAPDFRQLYFDFTNSTVGYTILGYNVALEKLNELQAQGQILDVVVPESSLQDPLEAESSIGYNAGLTYKENRWNAELNFFRNDFKNLIDTRVIARKTNGQNVFSYFNFDKIYTTGLECNTNYRITDNIRLSAGYQLLYAFDKEKEKQIKNGEVFARDPETNQAVVVSRSEYFGLVNRSRHNANFKVFYDIVSAKANINLRLLYRSKYALFDTNGNDLIDDYDTSFVNGFAIANIAASKTFYENFTLQIGANNLFDYTKDNIPTLPGIQLYAKLNYQF